VYDDSFHKNTICRFMNKSYTQSLYNLKLHEYIYINNKNKFEIILKFAMY